MFLLLALCQCDPRLMDFTLNSLAESPSQSHPWSQDWHLKPRASMQGPVEARVPTVWQIPQGPSHSQGKPQLSTHDLKASLVTRDPGKSWIHARNLCTILEPSCQMQRWRVYMIL